MTNFLPGATADPTEEVAWDDDDEEEAEESTTPSATTTAVLKPSNDSTTTLSAPTPVANDLLKPNEPRRSHEDDKSVAGSDASYDVISGTTSRAPDSPKDGKKDVGKEESDGDDDWE